ncbi:2-oxo-4-hydroxy-4-carboxy-5-ureidoimidazoline decarboxylase [Mycobacterium sp. NPDC050041]|uniref:2-oxo-4-hydroxy-4-carboxy-5-ureidoimidazoline decarboxylase n=1 Tax=Mycobacterium sp. NPDC050041 TaxID=3364293 RepID=UPI003C2CDB1D
MPSAGLADFNRLPGPQRVRLLTGVCASPLWAQRVAAGAPYADVDTLLDVADRVLAELSEAEIDAALAGHPRIGGQVDNAASAREQAGVMTAGDDVRAELTAKNRAYERRFGHVYLVCASGRSAEDLLATLTGRLANDAGTERRVLREELAKINRLRLRQLVGDPS